MTYDFYSDNASGCHPTILAALADANAGTARPYGADSLSQTLDAAVSEIFETTCFAFPVPTGTAANGLALGAISPSYGEIFAHRSAHIVTTGCGAPEFFTSGARLHLLDGPDTKISAETLVQALAPYATPSPHACVKHKTVASIGPQLRYLAVRSERISKISASRL